MMTPSTPPVSPRPTNYNHKHSHTHTHNHHHSRRRRKTASSSTSSSSSHSTAVMRRTLYAWILLGLCGWMMVNQVRQTKKAVLRQQQLGLDHQLQGDAFFLPEYQTLDAIEEEYFAWDTNSTSRSGANSSGMLGGTSISTTRSGEGEGAQEDDALMDDDNVFDDDKNTDDETAKEEAPDTTENNKQDIEEAPSSGTTPQYDHYAAKRQAFREKRQQRHQMVLEQLQHQLPVTINSSQLTEGYHDAMAERQRVQQLDSNDEIIDIDIDRQEAQRLAEYHESRRGTLPNSKRRYGPFDANQVWKPPHWNDTHYFKQFPSLLLEQANNHPKMILPDMTTDKGGVVFFLHVPKTGGQTIRQFNLRFRKHLQRQALHQNDGIMGADTSPLMAGPGRRYRLAQGRFTTFGNDIVDRTFHAVKNNNNISDNNNQGQERRRRLQAFDLRRPPLQQKYLPARQQRQRQYPPQTPKSPEQVEFEDLTRNKLRFVSANTLKVFAREAVPQVNAYFSLASQHQTPDKILFVEVHGMDNYHIFELEPYLQYWRQQAKESGVPFFAFTLLREAISLQVSFFNYYYIHPADSRFCINPLKPQVKCGAGGGGGGPMDRRRNHRERLQKRNDLLQLQKQITQLGDDAPNALKDKYHQMEQELMMHKRRPIMGGQSHANGIQGVTHQELEKAMLQVAYENPQCLFLARGERTFGDEGDAKHLREIAQLRRPECQETYQSLQRTMDWIGRTDTLSTETLPMLTHILFGKPHLGKHVPKVNVSPSKGGYVKLSELQPSTQKTLERMSQFDQELYHRAMEDYTMDQWVNETNYQ